MGGDPAADSTTSPSVDTTAKSVDPGGTSDEATTGAGRCTISVSGDIEIEETFDQNIYSIVTDYWITEEEARDSFEFLQEEGSTETYEDRVASGKPIVNLFSFSCGAGPGATPSVLAYVTDATTRNDFPMASGTYPVHGSTLGGDHDGPAALSLANLFVEDEAVFRPVPQSGALDIETWDQSRLAGTLTFDAEEMDLGSGGDRSVSVTVDFDFSCTAEFHSTCR